MFLRPPLIQLLIIAALVAMIVGIAAMKQDAPVRNPLPVRSVPVHNDG